jgi:hypothetical protein
MVDIECWMEAFLSSLNATFENRICFVGLQGSYGRGEATEASDIDVVVILDALSSMDISAYNAMLDTMEYRTLICGFISGKNELLHWEPSDLFQFYHDTKPIKGSLDDLLPLLDSKAVDRSIKMGACNIYHGCVHNMLHEKNEDVLRSLYKSASFVVQAIAYKQTGKYISSQTELFKNVSVEECVIIENYAKFKRGEKIAFDNASTILFTWAQKWILKE